VRDVAGLVSACRGWLPDVDQSSIASSRQTIISAFVCAILAGLIACGLSIPIRLKISRQLLRRRGFICQQSTPFATWPHSRVLSGAVEVWLSLLAPRSRRRRDNGRAGRSGGVGREDDAERLLE
jgi:hypothetical protein